MSIDELPLSKKEMSSVVNSVSNVWGTEAENEALEALQTLIESRYKQEIRWHWHLLSVAFFSVGVILIQRGEEVAGFGGVVLLLWLGSVLFHAFYAQNELSARLNRINDHVESAAPTVIKLLRSKKNALVQGAPFDKSGLSRKFGLEAENVSAVEAEHLCANWMSLLGEENVEVTQVSSDGGIDITSNRCVAQVKNYKGSVGVGEVRAFFGASVVDGRLPLFFTSGTYTKAAIEFADSAGVYLYWYSAKQGTLNGINDLARTTLQRSSF